MILLSELLDEDGEAAAQAKQMGLISKGWGRWADPRTGKVTHKTDGGQLVAVDPQQDKSGGEKEIGPKPTQSKLGQIAKDLKGKVGRASTKRQRAKAGADTDFDAVEKLRQITSSPQDFEKASKMYHQGHDMKDIEAQFGNKKKPSGGKELDRASKIGTMLDKITGLEGTAEVNDNTGNIEYHMGGDDSITMGKTKDGYRVTHENPAGGTLDGADQTFDSEKDAVKHMADVAKRVFDKNKYDDPKYKKGDWWDDPELQDEPDNKKRPSDMSTGNPKYDKFLNTVEDKVKNLDVNIGDTYSPEEFAQKSGISPDQQKAYHKLYRSTETWEVPAFELIPGKEGKTSVFIPDPQDV